MPQINPLVNELCRQAAQDGAAAIGWRWEPDDSALHIRYIADPCAPTNDSRLSRLLQMVGDAGRLHEHYSGCDGLRLFTAAGIAGLHPAALPLEFSSAAAKHSIGQFSLDVAVHVRMSG